MSTAQRRSATKSRRSASKTQTDVQVAPEAEVQAPRPGESTSRPPKPAPPKEVDPSKPRSGISVRIERLRKLMRDTWSEIKKITWPDSETVKRLTVLVIAMATALGLLLGGIDYVLLKVFEALS